MLYSNLAKKLQCHETKRITEKELRAVCSNEDYYEYYQLVGKLVDEGAIFPVKSSGSNGMNPPLFKRYTINKQENSPDSFISEIRLLSRAFNVEGYLGNPSKYLEHRALVQDINAFINSNSYMLTLKLSINERSFQIFGKEKFLKDDKNLQAILNFNPALQIALNYYMTPEPFFIHSIKKLAGNINILIIENKDTWYTLKSVMTPGMNKIFGICFDVLLYGEGKKITRKLDSLTEFDRSFFEQDKTTYYYFGDLDYEGIGIFNDVRIINPDLNIKLFKELYSWMLREAATLTSKENYEFALPDTKENQSIKELDRFLEEFDCDEKILISSMLAKGKYIPQEILNRGCFLSKLEKCQKQDKEGQ